MERLEYHDILYGDEQLGPYPDHLLKRVSEPTSAVPGPVERRSEREVCTIMLSDSTSYRATDVRIQGDRTIVRLVPTGDSLGIATQEVESFTFTSRAMGAGHGALIGAAAGGGVGALFGLSLSGPAGGWAGGGESTYLEGAVGGAMFFGGVGSVLGAIVGAGKGGRDMYRPYPKESEPSAGDPNGRGDRVLHRRMGTSQDG